MHILHHRIAIFEEIGLHDAPVLDRVETVSRDYFTEPFGLEPAWVEWQRTLTDR